jgi:hypothetical protein
MSHRVLVMPHHRERDNVFPNYRNPPIVNFRSQRRPAIEATTVMRQGVFTEARLSTSGGRKSLKLLSTLSSKALTTLDKT